MAATMEAPEALVSRPDTTLLFMSRRSALRLTKRKRFPIRDQSTGEMRGMTQGEYVGFRDGVFRCPAEGRIVLQDTLDGGEAEVDAAEVVAYLRRHRLFGDLQEGFWEVDPVAPPVSEAEMQTLLDAAMSYDEQRVASILEQERAGWNREALVASAERALDGIRTVNAAAAEKARAEAEAKPKPKG